MPDGVYTDLARFLDNLPGGFPVTESAVERRIFDIRTRRSRPRGGPLP